MSAIKFALVFLTMSGNGASGQQYVSSDACAKVGDRFRMTCVTPTVTQLTWKRSNSQSLITLYPIKTDCNVEDSFVYDLARYNFSCDSNMFTMDINNITVDDLDTSWLVRVDGNGLALVTVRLCVVVKSVSFKQPIGDQIDVVESVQETFRCQTSASWPPSTITWYQQSPNNAEEDSITLNIITNFTTKFDNLSITISSLIYSLTRQYQNYTLYCKANNTDEESVTSTNRPSINVLYAPDNIMPSIPGVANSLSIIENATLNFTCVIQGGNPRPILTWICNGGTMIGESIGFETKVRVVWTAERNYDGPCTCISYHPLLSTNQSDTVEIEILYPPTKPALSIDGVHRTGTVTVNNNTLVTVRCLCTSKPPPDYVWLYDNNQHTGDTISLQINQNISVRCTASNTMSMESGVISISSDVLFHMLYGPTAPKLSCLNRNSEGHINGSTVAVIDGDMSTLTCSANGDPEPSYKWNGQEGRTLTISNISQDTIVYNCTAYSYLQPDIGNHSQFNSSSIVEINKLYGPQTSPVLTYTYSSGATDTLTTSLSVVENSTFRITCINSKSRPLSKYTWVGNFESDSGVLDVTAIQRSPIEDIDGTSYHECTCLVRNTMVNTCGVQRTEIGTWNRTQIVNVLFAASLHSVPDQSVLEGNSFTLPAHVRYHGSPRERYKWSYNRIELASNLTYTIHNVSRFAAGFYTIEATNQISPTGLKTHTVSVNQTFYLNVFYTTSISTFNIDGQDGNVTVNESVQVELMCHVDSNPASNINLHSSTYDGVNELAQSKLTNELVYKLQKATCYDTGVYVCNGKINYTSTQAVERSYLFVRCKPRPRYPVKPNITVYSALGESVTLNMTVIAYPLPSPGQFTWVKINGQNETVITTEPNTNITTADLNTELTIKHLHQTDLGQYKLTIQNSNTGNGYIHYFFIATKDKPQMPTQFTYIEERLTETSAFFEWKPGFDGGLPQTFLILYKTHWNSIWNQISVAGSNTTLTELFPNTLYYVKMYAHNEIGNSSETTVLNITTTELFIEKPEVSTLVIGLIVGGGTAAIIVVIVVVVIRVRYNRKQGQKSDQGRQELYTDDHIYDADGMEANMAYESAESLGIQHMPVGGDVYAQVDISKNTTNKPSDNTYAVVDKTRKTGADDSGEGDVYAMPNKTKKSNKKVKKGKNKKQTIWLHVDCAGRWKCQLIY